MEKEEQNQPILEVEEPQAEPQEIEQSFNEPSQKEEAGCFAIGISLLFPVIGIIIYFSQKKEVRNPSAYLIAAGIGMVLGIILKAASDAI